MGTIKQISAAILIAALISCSGGANKPKQAGTVASVEPKATIVAVNDESQKLLKFLEESGDYVNGRNFPSLIKASVVHAELAGKIKIVDLRSPEAFAKGHIKGAVNVEFSQIPDYFTNVIKPFEYDKIVMVCYAGQIASYTTSLLRLMGYGNVYAMRWGMSGWNKDFAAGSWLKGISDKYEGSLETDENGRAALSDFPQMNTGKSTGEEILAERFKSLFAAGYDDAFINADQVFEQPANFYTVNTKQTERWVLFLKWNQSRLIRMWWFIAVPGIIPGL